MTPSPVDRNRWIRLFNRLEAAVTHHKRATAEFTTDADDALYVARDRILKAASEAEQGVRLVEQPKCPGCEGTGRYRDPRIWGTMPGSVACGTCNGTGYARLVDLP